MLTYFSELQVISSQEWLLKTHLLSFTQIKPSYEEAHVTKAGHVQIQGQVAGANTRPNVDLAVFQWYVKTACD